MKLLEQNRYTITDVAKLLHVHTSTVWRWKLQGVRGVKLKTIVIGGTRYVLESDLNNFLVALNDGNIEQDDDIDARSSIASARLDAMGVKEAK